MRREKATADVPAPDDDGARRPRVRYVGIVAAFMAMAALFFTGTQYTSSQSREISNRVQAVSADALPSVIYLVAMRRHVDRIVRDLHEVVREHLRTDADVEGGFAAIEAESDGYLRTPMVAGEERAWRETRALLDELHAAVRRTQEAIDAGDFARAEDVFFTVVRPAERRVELRIQDVIDINTRTANEAAAEVVRDQGRVTRTALALDGVSLFASAFAVFLALRRVRRSTKQLERRAEELEQFSARVAHDIRGPLSPAMLALGLIAEKGDAGQRGLAERGIRGLRSAQSILDGLLSFALCNAKPAPGVRAPLRAAIDEVIAETEPLAREDAVTVVASPVPDVEVACAEGVLLSVVSNLVRNAITHMGAAKDERRVSVSAERAGRLVRIEVKDTGPGVDAELAATIFEPYVRGAGAKTKGFGLGLATVKVLAEAHGGRAGMESALGRGSTFWVELPIAGAPGTTAHAIARA